MVPNMRTKHNAEYLHPYYRAQAGYCRDRAEDVGTPTIRNNYLLLAAGWDALERGDDLIVRS
jgi:hypothetical protein